MTELAIEKRGLRRLENLVVVILVLVLVAVAHDRIVTLKVDAEKFRLELSVNNLRSALSNEIVRRLSGGAELASLIDLAESNPMDLAEPPEGYLGAGTFVNPFEQEPGTWYFDTNERVLVYRVINDRQFISLLPEPARVRLRIEAIYDDRNHNGSFEPEYDNLSMVQLTSTEPYRWRSTDEANGLQAAAR